MKVNGELLQLAASCTVREFLIAQKYPTERVAVERNGEIVPRAQFDDVLLEDSDKLEIVSFVGGG